MNPTVRDLSLLPSRAWRILRWGWPMLPLSARLELIRLLFVDALRGERGQ
jgi:hypothetical protein